MQDTILTMYIADKDPYKQVQITIVMENINRDRDKILKQKKDWEKEWENVKRKSNEANVALDREDNKKMKRKRKITMTVMRKGRIVTT